MRRKTLLILCVVVGVAIIAVVGFFSKSSLLKNILEPTLVNKAAQPDELLQQYFACIANGQYDGMYEMLTAQSKEMISKDEFVAKHKSIYGGIEAKNITVTIGQISDSSDSMGKSEPGTAQKIVEYSLRMDTSAGEISNTNSALFTLNEDKEYRMQWTTHTIFPNLNPEDKVRVNTIKAERGCIYDRNGEMLAGEGVASAVGFVPGKMQGGSLRTASPSTSIPDASLEPTISSEIESETISPELPSLVNTPAPDVNMDITKVAELLEMTPESIQKKLSASYVKEDTFVELRRVSKDAYELKEQLLTIPGIKISDVSVRFYPLGEKASHLTGYIQSISAEELDVLKGQGYHMNSLLGKAGIEKIYEDKLRAMDGYEIYIVDSDGKKKETLARTEAKNGEDVYLNIDARVQNALFDQFMQDKSCSVAMNPKTGEVLALVSTPAYNANDFVLGMPMARWTALNEDVNKPMWNRFKAAMCPGSTFKAVTAAIGVETGIVEPSDDYGHSGLRWRKDESWGGYYITTTMEYEGPANVRNALKFSDNIFFGKAALKIGPAVFAEQLKRIGFEERIPFEYGLYSSIISNTETFTSEIQLADSGYGQGQILTNPIHLACIYAAFVNDGNMLKPRLLLDGEIEPEVWIENAFSAETARIIRDDLIQVIESGSAKDARIDGMILAGKTGTAEIKQSKDDVDGTELGWFAMFTTDENANEPLLIISMVEDVKDRGGSHYVVPKVKTVIESGGN